MERSRFCGPKRGLCSSEFVDAFEQPELAHVSRKISYPIPIRVLRDKAKIRRQHRAVGY